MILVDTSVWIDHFRARDEQLARLLDRGQVVTHSFITGELALGNLLNRDAILGAMQNLPQAPMASDDEVLRFIDNHALHGLGIGYIDVHLLAASCLAPGTRLWTRDKRLLIAATHLGIAESTAH